MELRNGVTMFGLCGLILAGCVTVKKVDHSEAITRGDYYITSSDWHGAKGSSGLALKVFRNGDKIGVCGATLANNVGTRLHDKLMDGITVNLGGKRLMTGIGKFPRYRGATLVGKRAACFETGVEHYEGYEEDKIRIRASRTTFYN